MIGHIIELKNYSPRTEGLTVVPFEVKPDKDGDYYNCVIVRGKTLSGMTIGEILAINVGGKLLVEGKRIEL